jgi:hypothetical protein
MNPQAMHPAEALQYLSSVCADFVRTLPASTQGPTVQVVNAALSSLRDAITPPEVGENPRHRDLAAVPNA